jgi:hypothetical protein
MSTSTENDKSTYDIVPMPEGSTHKYKKVCKTTGKFLGWHSGSNSNSAMARKQIMLKLEPYATKWEKEFIKSIAKREKLSDKQNAVWQKMIKDYIEVGVLDGSQ